MTARKVTIKWNIPQSSTDEDSTSDKNVYSDTFVEDKSTCQYNSDTFLSESYSDTFVNETLKTSFSKEQNKDDSSTENIRTAISFRTSFDESEIQDATFLETAQTGALETVMEVDSDLSSTGVTDTFRTSYEEDTLSNDPSKSLAPDSYSDTFESSERTKLDSQYQATHEMVSARSTDTKSYDSKSYTDYSSDDDSLLDRSYIAPDYDGKALTDDEDESHDDDYSFTFEPTDTTSYPMYDHGKVKYDSQQFNISEQKKKDFVKSLVQKLRAKPDKKASGLKILPVESTPMEEDKFQRYFCKKKLKMLRKKKDTEVDVYTETTDNEVTEQYSGKLLSDYGITDSVLERAKITNIMSAMKRAAEEEIHEPKKCPECRELKSRLDAEDAERKFVTTQARRLKNKIMDARVEEHLLKMNSISMIAELARTLPKHSERPEKILDKLFEPLLGKNVMR
ncbi:hypothetical protein ACF0H5_011194 [Mactra antiquata]